MTTYWKNKGKHQQFYDALASHLVPVMGRCETLQGECVRAATRIYCDFMNNGFGNNWSGAYNFLKQNLPSGSIPDNIWYELDYYKCGRVYGSSVEDSVMADMLEQLMDCVPELVQEVNGIYQPNTTDMFSLQDPEVYE
jgi:hypothetical protein